MYLRPERRWGTDSESDESDEPRKEHIKKRPATPPPKITKWEAPKKKVLESDEVTKLADQME